MNQSLILIGTLLIFAGFILIILGSLFSPKQGKVEWAVGGFIGPIAFGAFSSKNMFYVLIGLMVLTLLFFILFGRFR
jgi:uncharacterized membrane protein